MENRYIIWPQQTQEVEETTLSHHISISYAQNLEIRNKADQRVTHLTETMFTEERKKTKTLKNWKVAPVTRQIEAGDNMLPLAWPQSYQIKIYKKGN